MLLGFLGKEWARQGKDPRVGSRVFEKFQQAAGYWVISSDLMPDPGVT